MVKIPINIRIKPNTDKKVTFSFKNTKPTIVADTNDKGIIIETDIPSGNLFKITKDKTNANV